MESGSGRGSGTKGAGPPMKSLLPDSSSPRCRPTEIDFQNVVSAYADNGTQICSVITRCYCFCMMNKMSSLMMWKIISRTDLFCFYFLSPLFFGTPKVFRYIFAPGSS